MWYRILTQDPFGRRVWSEELYRKEDLVSAARSGLLATEARLLSISGIELSVDDLLPKKSLSLGEGLLIAGAVVGGGFLLGAGLSWLAKRASRTVEQKSIAASVDHHQSRGADVVADHVGMGIRPPKVNGRIPDVVAYYPNGRVVMEEHETREGAGRRHSREQDADLRRYASRRKRVTYRQVIADD